MVENNWALIEVDVQNDFCPGGSLAVKDGDQVVEPLNEVYKVARKKGQLTIATRDWHPAETTHFAKYGGVWPEHCIQGTLGAEFHPGLLSPKSDSLLNAMVFSKGMGEKEDAFSGFQAIYWGKAKKYRPSMGALKLADWLKLRHTPNIVVGGLATDYCVKATVLDGCKLGYDVTVLTDAIRAVNLKPGDGEKALDDMVKAGAKLMSTEEFLAKAA